MNWNDGKLPLEELKVDLDKVISISFYPEKERFQIDETIIFLS